VIELVDPNFAADQCIESGDPTFCSLIHRNLTGAAAGTIISATEPVANLGELETDGFDFNVEYKLRGTPIGDFAFMLNATHTDHYEVTSAPGTSRVDYAGQYSSEFGNYARIRGKVGIGWSLHDLNALLTARYIDHLTLPTPDAGTQVVQVPLAIPSVTTFDLSVGYTLPTGTHIQAGMINMFDRAPPIYYQNNVINANTDVSTYDVLGRRFFIGFNQKF